MILRKPSPRYWTLFLIAVVTVCPVFVVATACGGEAAAPTGSNWPSFRGPAGNGYSTETDVPVKWSATSGVTWRVPLPGVGGSTPVVWGDRIFVTAALEGGFKRSVLCFSRTGGRLLWQKTFETGDPGRTHRAMNGHASSTCALDADQVYAFFGKGGMVCLDHGGDVVWKRKLPGEFLSIWGSASSPIVIGETVVIVCDQDTVLGMEADPNLPSQAYIVALDRKTGKDVWKTPRSSSRGWSTPLLLDESTGLQLVVNGPIEVAGYDAHTGKLIWQCKKERKFGTPMIVADEKRLYALSGRPAPLLAIRRGGRGDITGTHIAWSARRSKRDLPSPVLVNDLLFAIGKGGILICYEAKTGKEHYTTRLEPTAASPVFANGHIYSLSRAGNTTVFRPEKAFSKVAQNSLPTEGREDFLASPAISQGQVFLRSTTALYCIGEATQPAESP